MVLPRSKVPRVLGAYNSTNSSGNGHADRLARAQPASVRVTALAKSFSRAQGAAAWGGVVGLYMTPPRHAVVVSIDEKSQIQALDRTQPGLPLKRGKCATLTHDY